MNKTIKINVTLPPFGVDGKENPLPSTKVVYRTFKNVLPEATCVYLKRNGVAIAIATVGDNGEKRYESLVVPTLLSQSFEMDGAFSKLLNVAGYGSLEKYTEQLNAEYQIGQENIAHSIYHIAANKISESLTKALASDENEIIEFNYQIEFDNDAVLSMYGTEAGGTYKVREQKFYNPFKEPKGMSQIYNAKTLGTAARAELGSGQVPDGSFITFWNDIPTPEPIGYQPSSLEEVANLAADALSSTEEKQNEAWTEAYAN